MATFCVIGNAGSLCAAIRWGPGARAGDSMFATTSAPTKVCQRASIARAARVDAAVANAFPRPWHLPSLMRLSRARRAQLQADTALRASADRQLERKRYAAALAERQFNKVDPDNRSGCRGTRATLEK